MNFLEVKQFFMAWGLNPDVSHSLSDVQLEYMYRAAIKKSNEFEIFCNLMINSKEDGHFLDVDSWDALEKYWETFVETGKIK